MSLKKRFVDWAYHIFWALPLPESLLVRIHNFYRRRLLGTRSSSVDAREVYKAFADATRKRQTYDAICQAYEPQSVDPILIAYYLPQFHPTEENNKWWGAGVTEWNNVTRALPQFSGHRQPRVPGDLGYYDLRIDEVIRDQANLAREHGISAFAVYFYWFGGDRRLLSDPLNTIATLANLQFKFCLCWANESWTRRFDGVSSSVLMEQDHSIETYFGFSEIASQYMLSENYLEIDSKPVVVIYRPAHIPEVKRVLAHWRNVWKSKNGKDVIIVAVRDFSKPYDWIEDGFDAETAFQPSQIMSHQKPINSAIKPINPDFAGKVFDYREAVEKKLHANIESRNYIPAVASGWDNSPRRDNAGVIYINESPDLYKQWLVEAIKSARESSPNAVFINAWNEWGEGAYLEPDTYNGKGYLLATRDAIVSARHHVHG